MLTVASDAHRAHAPHGVVLDAGTPIYDTLLAETDTKLVFFELDIAWIEAGGQSAYDYLRKHGPQRFRTEGGATGHGLGLTIALGQAEVLGARLTFANVPAAVATITVDEGPSLKRMHARAKGRGSRITKRTSHITVVVGE